jgi:hypothetical protein
MTSSRCQYHLTALAEKRNEQTLTCKQKPTKYIVGPDRRIHGNNNNTMIIFFTIGI